MSIVRFDDYKINVTRAGKGEPVLLLHGVPDSSDIWEQTITRLAPHCRCYAPDLPGFGLSKVPSSFSYSLDNLAEFVNKLLEALQLRESVHLVIHDIGGIVGLAFAIKHPQKVKSLTIMDTTFFSNHRWHKLARIWRKPILGDLAMHLMNFKRFAQAMKHSAPAMNDSLLRSSYAKLTFRNRRMILKFYRALDPQVFLSWEERLLETVSKIPSQVIWGRDDDFLPVALANRFGAEDIHILDNAGHWPMLDQVNKVAELIQSNIDKAGLKSAA